MLPTSSNQRSKRMQKDPWQLPQTSPLQSPAPLAATLPHSDSTFPWRSAARSPGEHLRHPVTVTGWTQKWGPTLLMATRNPANSPVEVGSWKPIIYRVLIHLRWLALGFLPSTVFLPIKWRRSNPSQPFKKERGQLGFRYTYQILPLAAPPKTCIFFWNGKKKKVFVHVGMFFTFFTLVLDVIQGLWFPWATKTMKNKGFGHQETRLLSINTSKNIGFGGPWLFIVET